MMQIFFSVLCLFTSLQVASAADCPISTYRCQTNTCCLCPNNCISCTTGTTCTKCFDGYELRDFSCSLKCKSPCNSCSLTPGTCTSCISGFVLDKANNQCNLLNDKCPDSNAFYSYTDGKCKDCLVPNCKKCVGPDSCALCLDTYVLKQ